MFSKPSLLLLLASSSQAIQKHQQEQSLIGLVAESNKKVKYESALHMDAFSLDHDKNTKGLSAKGKPLSNILGAKSFGFGKEGSETFSNAFTSVDSELDRLHQKFDDPNKKSDQAPSSMPMFSLFSAHATDPKTDKKKDISKLDAPVAKADKVVTKETTLNVDGDIFHPATPLELPSQEEQSKMRSVLGLDSNDEDSTQTHTSFATIWDNGLVQKKSMSLSERLTKTREANKDLFHPFKSSFLSQQPQEKEAELATPNSKELDKILGISKKEKTKSGDEDFGAELRKMRGEVVIKKSSQSDSFKSELSKLRDQPATPQHKNSVKEMLTGDAFQKSLKEMMTGDSAPKK